MSLVLYAPGPTPLASLPTANHPAPPHTTALAIPTHPPGHRRAVPFIPSFPRAGFLTAPVVFDLGLYMLGLLLSHPHKSISNPLHYQIHACSTNTCPHLDHPLVRLPRPYPLLLQPHRGWSKVCRLMAIKMAAVSMLNPLLASLSMLLDSQEGRKVVGS